MSKPKLSIAAIKAAESAAAAVTAQEARQAEREAKRKSWVRKRKREESAIERRCRPEHFSDAQWILVWDRASEINNGGGLEGLEDEIDTILDFLAELDRSGRE